jgi:hypothetical protein
MLIPPFRHAGTSIDLTIPHMPMRVIANRGCRLDRASVVAGRTPCQKRLTVSLSDRCRNYPGDSHLKASPESRGFEV